MTNNNIRPQFHQNGLFHTVGDREVMADGVERIERDVLVGVVCVYLRDVV
jgi:hypothetical protein